MQKHREENSWRNFQDAYIFRKKKRDTFFKLFRRGFALLIIVGAIFAAYTFYPTIKNRMDDSSSDHVAATSAEKSTPPKEVSHLSRNELGRIIKPIPLNRTDKNVLFVDFQDKQYKIATSIDIYLQEYLLSMMDRLKLMDRGKPQEIAIVVMAPDTGKIIAMAGFDLADPNANPCVRSDFPAASIIKIITAAAAVESLGYTPHTPLYFNGNKYTLYKRQLKETRNKYTYKTSLGNAFSESVNPVFGKIGKTHLGREKLETYAAAFGFNQMIDTELPFVTGNFSTEGSDYHLAELGCGFNTKTTISPMFAAMITSAMINSGHLMLPSIIEHVTAPDGEIIYKSEKSTYKSPIRPETAETMVRLMEKTVTRGTARKSFRGVSRDAVLSRLTIGGKTGSLYNKAHTIKYDWFTGFGREIDGEKKVAVSILVGHRKYIGTRAATYAKLILKEFFTPQ